MDVQVEPEVADDPLSRARALLLKPSPLGIAMTTAPSLDALVELARARPDPARPVALAVIEPSSEATRLRQVALDLGIAALSELGPLLATLRLLEISAEQPWAATVRGLPQVDRTRLRLSQLPGTRSGDQLVPSRAGCVAFAPAGDRAKAVDLGAAHHVAEALAALRDTDRGAPRMESSVDSVNERAVLDVLFGPRRALSDPTSKAALAPYGMPMPSAELCSSASRAAAEASRIGFPVRISLASPDLRVWEHPDLAVDMVDNAARVRDCFRQLMGLARTRLASVAPNDKAAADRILGVMVTETSETLALLGVRARPLPQGCVGMEIAFADAHGSAADDRTLFVTPAPQDGVERALRRLAGHSLLLRGQGAQRRANLDAIAEVLLRLHAFVHDRRKEVTSVELRPLAVLLDGATEIREACVTVSDAFERGLGAELGQRLRTRAK